MPMSTITVAGINPGLNVLGVTQQFNYNNYNQNLATFQINNSFVPTSLVSSQTNLELRNNVLSGFRWIHLTNNTDTYGSMKLQSFVNGAPTGTDFIGIDNTGVSFYNDVNYNNNLITDLATPISGTDGANKDYVDNKTWVVADITDFTSAVTAFRLDQFAAPNTDLSINSHKLTNVSTPTTSNDAANKTYVDNKTWTASEITDFTSATNTLIDAATILPSKISGYPSNAGVFLRGDGTWSAVPAKAYSSIILTANATATTVTTGGTYYKVAGTTTSIFASGFSTAVTNRLESTGTATIDAMIQVSLDASHNALATTILTFALFKNGSIASSFSAPIQESVLMGDSQSFSINSIITLSQTDYVELFVTAASSATDVTIANLNFSAQSL